VKTYAEWEGDLNQYLEIGDEVDEEMVDYFINVLPPATMTGTLVQAGEPQNHMGGRATFITFKKEGSCWFYVGHCFRGETTSRD
jgi:hypothetical protein